MTRASLSLISGCLGTYSVNEPSASNYRSVSMEQTPALPDARQCPSRNRFSMKTAWLAIAAYPIRS